MECSEHRCGFVAVVGRPNVGKSTLVNRIVGADLSIVTAKAQTTRHRITAIFNSPGVQMILQDTPGIHDPKTPLNRALVETAAKTLENADIILFMVSPERKIADEDLIIAKDIQAARVQSVLAINKIDTTTPADLLPVIEAYDKVHSFHAIVPISAALGSGVEELVEVLAKLLPEGPSLFPEDELSDLPLRFFVAEIIREQIMNLAWQEIPYKTAVVVESFKEDLRPVLIQADIHVERESQKRILVGKGGSMIKKIGTEARKKIEEFLECRVRLELFVKVTPRWTHNARMLREFGY